MQHAHIITETLSDHGELTIVADSFESRDHNRGSVSLCLMYLHDCPIYRVQFPVLPPKKVISLPVLWGISRCSIAAFYI